MSSRIIFNMEANIKICLITEFNEKTNKVNKVDLKNDLQNIPTFKNKDIMFNGSYCEFSIKIISRTHLFDIIDCLKEINDKYCLKTILIIFNNDNFIKIMS